MAVCCDEPLVVGLVRFCTEIGLVPVMVATGRGAPGFDAKIRDSVDEPGAKKDLLILSDADFDEIDGRLEAVKVDLCIGTGKLQKSARKTGLRSYASGSRFTTVSAPIASCTSAIGEGCSCMTG